MGDASQWTVQEVSSQLRTVGLSKYQSEFVARRIDGKSLFSLKEADLRTIGMPVMHRMTFMNWVSSLPHSRAPPRSTGPKTAAAPATLATKTVTSTTKPSAAVPRTSTATKAPASSSGARRNPDPPTSKPAFNAGKSTKTRGAFACSPDKPRPRGTSTVHTFGAQEDDFDLKDLSFNPPAKVASIPKPARLGRGPRGPSIPEAGDIGDRVPCRYCGRNFASDRISTHEPICGRSGAKKRKVFDSTKQRTGRSNFAIKKSTNFEAPRKPKMFGGKPAYVIEHENLVASLRAAKKMVAYESAKAAGKATGPPPPMPVIHEIDDRIQCKYCGRKFGQEQLERHMRFCQNTLPAPRARMSNTKTRGRR